MERLESFKGMYGRKIVSSLAYAYAMRGDSHKAKTYLNEYEKSYGIIGKNEEEHRFITHANQMINSS